MARKIVTTVGSIGLSMVAMAVMGAEPVTAVQPTLAPRLTLQAPSAKDQDDLTFWLHPADLSRSLVITSDKSAGKVFVYDLEGKLLQAIAAQLPGNIDTRYGFQLGKELVDIIAFNERKTNKIRVYRVHPETRQLEQIDDGTIDSGPNYGLALYKNPRTGRFYAFTGPKDTPLVKQFELVNSGQGRISAVGPLRQLQPGGTAEGMVADDEEGKLYLAEESGGIWKFEAEPNAPATGAKIAAVGENGLAADVEGLTIYYSEGGGGYLIASSQGNSTFRIYDRQAPHHFLGSFSVGGVMRTDGVDVINLPLGTRFPQGVFASHNGRAGPFAVQLVQWQDVASALDLRVDTRYWDPRQRRVEPLSPAIASGTNVPLARPEAKAAESHRDRTPPIVTAALVAAGKVEDDEGYFQVQASCRDNDNQGVTTMAHINGMTVAHGQKVKLEVDDKTKIKRKHDILKFEAPDFRLVVACRDAAGNQETAAVTPTFAKGGRKTRS